MDWTKCKDNKLVKEISPDENLIESLKQSSSKKMESANMLNINETTASSVISLCYESLREILEALAIKNNFKIYNHDCYCAFLDEILKEEDLAISFDRFRKIRNKINYYGKDISIEDANSLKKEIEDMVVKTNKLME